jgi:putative ABC transport system substrate-binding protein
MKRRDLLCQLPAWLAVPALAQTPASPKLLVVLASFEFPKVAAKIENDTRQELARLGWRLGDNLRLEIRYGDNRPERLDELARELLALQPAAALAVDDYAVRALMRYSTRLPIVAAFAINPVANGLAASLGRPGGQVTGMTNLFEDIRPKTYELARQVAPSARRLAGMFDRSLVPDGQLDAAMAGPRRMAQQAGLEYLPLPVRNAGEIEAALRSLTPVREHALLVNVDTLVYVNFASIAAQARALRLPSGSQAQHYVESGGLFAYGTDVTAVWLRTVQKADQVLRGQPVGEIPFEQPTRIILTLNRDTARNIGLTFPHELLLRADEVIG